MARLEKPLRLISDESCVRPRPAVLETSYLMIARSLEFSTRLSGYYRRKFLFLFLPLTIF